MTNTEIQIPEMTENFEALLNEQFGDKGITGSVVKGTIIRVTPDFAIVDVGLKSEGRIPLREFGQTQSSKPATRLKFMLTVMKTKTATLFSPAKKHAAKKLGRILRNASTPAKESTALSSDALKAALPLTLTALLHSCRVLRLTFVRSATLLR